MLTIEQIVNLREVILCSTLSERPVKIEFKEQPEGNLQRFLQLMQSIQLGCKVEVTPKRVTYIPGVITNNSGVEFDFDCGNDRSIGYFLEPLLILSLYGKSEIKVNLLGFTNDSIDQSVDNIINNLVPLIKKFAPEWNPTLKVLKRGFRPNPTGKVHFNGQFIKYLKATDILERGPIKKIRGVCCGAKIAPNILNRIISSCRGVFNDYIPDVWIHSDFQKSQKGIDFSNGYGLSLIAESTQGCSLSIDIEFTSQKDTPESIGEQGALRLLDEIHQSGCVDTSNQQYALLLMSLAEKRISQVRLGRISVHTIETLRIIRDLIGVTFSIGIPNQEEQKIIQQNEQMEIEQDDKFENLQISNKIQQTMIFICMGAGLINISRQVK